LKIALTQRVLYHKQRAYDSLEHGWYNLLQHHTLTFIPNFPNQDFIQIADTHDALIITGGDDSSIRRATEFKLATAMMNHRKLILGVCHGSFTLVDALGGIITPDPNHMDCHHPILYQDELINVNSYHSQVISKLHTTGTGLAYDETGNCEAWIDDNIAGIAWHPERGDTSWLPSEILSTFGLQ
jgi:gamma-glutamyl-gamma-aminobutyrate hydrolase PuuD